MKSRKSWGVLRTRKPPLPTGARVSCKVFSSPHIFSGKSSAQIMWLVSICLLPAAMWPVWLYGWPALRVLGLSVFSCAASETILNLISVRQDPLYHNRSRNWVWTVDDGSAILSGLLLGMNLSPSAAWYIPVSAGVFAMAVCKWSFGGLGANWVNPALGGRAFVFFSFSKEMAIWPAPERVLRDGRLDHFDARTTASPLNIFKEGLTGEALQNWGQSMGLSPDDHSWNLFLGFHSGSMGDMATGLILLGGLCLLGLRIIRWHIPLAFLGSFALLTWIFGARELFQGEVLFHLSSGGLMLGAWFMATDYSSSPKMPLAKFIFGIGCGVLSFFSRFYGSYPEGVMLAILFMNICCPTLDMVFRPRIFGEGKKGSREGQDEKVLSLPSY